METYCSALVNQEKALEELQRHLRTTEDLFRESVKRKNQQLDLLQSEVRRLKTSVGVRDEAASLQIDAALNAQAGELRRAKEKLAERDSEVESLTRQVAQLKAELADEKARSEAQRAHADQTSHTQGAIAKRDEELQTMRDQLGEAQEWARRLQNASAETEAVLEARDAELAAMRQREDDKTASVALGEKAQAELESLRSRADELASLETSLRREQEARAAAEEHAQALEQEHAQLEESIHLQRDEMQRTIEQLRVNSVNPGSDSATQQVLQLRAQVADLQKRLSAADKSGAPRPIGVPTPAPALPPADDDDGLAVDYPTSSSQGAPSRAGSEGGGGGDPPAVRSLVVSGDSVVGAALMAEVSFIGCDATTAKFQWIRKGEATPLLTDSTTYVPNVEDLGHELLVRVTPIDARGQVGEALVASTSSPIALPGNIKEMVGNWIDLGQKRFETCIELPGEKDRQLLFTKDKLKIRDRSKSEKTIAKSEGYAGVAIRFDRAQPLAFTLSLGGKKAAVSTFQLACKREGERDLIALALMAFADPSALDRIPDAPTTQSTSLHLAAAGQITSQKPDGGGASPVSSMTSEQQTVADLEDVPTTGGAGPSSGAKPKSSNRSFLGGGRTLSFNRGPKNKPPK